MCEFDNFLSKKWSANVSKQHLFFSEKAEKSVRAVDGHLLHKMKIKIRFLQTHFACQYLLVQFSSLIISDLRKKLNSGSISALSVDSLFSNNLKTQDFRVKLCTLHDFANCLGFQARHSDSIGSQWKLVPQHLLNFLLGLWEKHMGGNSLHCIIFLVAKREINFC